MRLEVMYRIAASKQSIIEFLRERGVITSHASCPNCGSEMVTDFRRNAYRCFKSSYVRNEHHKKVRVQCDAYTSIFSGSWLHAVRKLRKTFILISLISSLPKLTQSELAYETGLSLRHVRYWSHKIDYILNDWVNANNSRRLGGSGATVEIDETKLGGRKLLRGREVNGQWVMGIFERVTRRLIIVPVADRSSHTLISVIRRFVSPATTIITDGWRSYCRLGVSGYNHLTVNHNTSFVNHSNGAHIQNIERSWRDLKANLPKYGMRRSRLESRIAHFIFTRMFPKHIRIETFFRVVGNTWDLN